MCGITGIFAHNETGRIHQINLQAATQALARRGPDHQGQYIEQNVALGHCRLAVLDISPKGHQPMQDPEKRYSLAFNGEIYNFKALRQELQQAGVNFQSQTDTEVVLHGLAHQGPAFLSKLNGFFALAWYNAQTQQLLLARDRYGIKPLYYFADADKLIFASEPASILAYGIQKQLNTTALYTYLQLNYLPPPMAMLQGMQQVQPGQYLTVQKNQVQAHTWYTLPEPAHPTKNLSFEKAKKQLQEHLFDAVKRRMISDVPLGAFLSGGIDSSIIVAAATQLTTQLHTFSIGYHNNAYFDETPYAEIVAQRCQTNHHTFKLKEDDLFDALDDVLDYGGEPFADSSALPVFILSQKVRKHITVALSGDGADELMAGYNKHMAEAQVQQGGWKVRLVKALLPLWQRLPQSRYGPISNKVRQLLRFANAAGLPPAQRYWLWASLASGEQAARMLTTTTLENLTFSNFEQQQNQWLAPFEKHQDLNGTLRADVGMLLPGDMLTKVDRMSMANSLEVRVPFLDHNVVNFMVQLPPQYKLHKGQRKHLLKEAFKPFLPNEIFHRPKHGFEVPLLEWFRTGLKDRIMEEWLNDDYIAAQNIFDVTQIKALKTQLFSRNPADVHARIWALICFQHWYKKYFD